MTKGLESAGTKGMKRKDKEWLAWLALPDKGSGPVTDTGVFDFCGSVERGLSNQRLNAKLGRQFEGDSTTAPGTGEPRGYCMHCLVVRLSSSVAAGREPEKFGVFRYGVVLLMKNIFRLVASSAVARLPLCKPGECGVEKPKIRVWGSGFHL